VQKLPYLGWRQVLIAFILSPVMKPSTTMESVNECDDEFRSRVRTVGAPDSAISRFNVTKVCQARVGLKNAFEQIEVREDRLSKENLALRAEVERFSVFEEILGTSAALRAVLSLVSKVAPTDCTVLLTGETGTGKELIARAIHKRSRRSPRAFVSLNCAAIPPALIATELFGHEGGAFTGALQRRLGRFERAEAGTLFLDEVGELPAETQVTLLRVLQEREFERVGGNQTTRADVRMIAAPIVTWRLPSLRAHFVAICFTVSTFFLTVAPSKRG